MAASDRTADVAARGEARPWLGRLFARPPAPDAASLVVHPRIPVRPADASVGRRLRAGQFDFGPARVDYGPGALPFGVSAPTRAWRLWFESFDWLADWIAGQPPGDRSDAARAAVDGWIGQQSKLGAIDDPIVAARRVSAWVSDAHGAFEGEAGAARRGALFAQAAGLLGAAQGLGTGLPRLHAALAVAYVGAAAPGRRDLLERGLALAASEVERQILPDGGHVGRGPSDLADLFRDATALDRFLHGLRLDAPGPLRKALGRMGPMVRFFRYPDGGLACFHGGGEGDRATIANLLDDDGPAPPRTFGFAPYAGYHRVEADGEVVVIDVAPPTEWPQPERAHASTLAFEAATPAGRLIVNRGAGACLSALDFEDARNTASHSALVVGGASSASLLGQGDRGPARYTRALGHVTARRIEDDSGVWIEGSHEGFRTATGFVHRRRVFVATSGGDIRGEDVVFQPVDAAPSRFGAARFAIHFHLHPDVQAAPAQDGKGVDLALPGGETWRFKSSGARMGLAASSYGARGRGLEDSMQILLEGEALPEGVADAAPNRVRWALKRQQPEAGR